MAMQGDEDLQCRQCCSDSWRGWGQRSMPTWLTVPLFHLGSCEKHDRVLPEVWTMLDLNRRRLGVETKWFMNWLFCFSWHESIMVLTLVVQIDWQFMDQNGKYWRILVVEVNELSKSYRFLGLCGLVLPPNSFRSTTDAPPTAFQAAASTLLSLASRLPFCSILGCPLAHHLSWVLHASLAKYFLSVLVGSLWIPTTIFSARHFAVDDSIFCYFWIHQPPEFMADSMAIMPSRLQVRKVEKSKVTREQQLGSKIIPKDYKLWALTLNGSSLSSCYIWIIYDNIYIYICFCFLYCQDFPFPICWLCPVSQLSAPWSPCRMMGPSSGCSTTASVAKDHGSSKQLHDFWIIMKLPKTNQDMF